MNVLFISNLFPDASNPTFGIHNARLVRHLAEKCNIRVIAPRSRLPFARRSRDSAPACCPEDAHLCPVYPEVSYVPKVGSIFNHRLYAAGVRDTLDTVLRSFRPDILLGAWVYPDGCAVAKLADETDLPFAVIAQGSDVHKYVRMPVRRRILRRALNRAHAVITRSRSLAELLAGAGVEATRIHVIHNGVDIDAFTAADPATVRNSLGLSAQAKSILFVGHLCSVKNPLLLVRAHAGICEQRPSETWTLTLIGEGPLRSAVAREARRLGFGHQVHLAGTKAPADVARHMQAADVLCVPSNNEGIPNVIREAFACGLPVVATRVGGIPEIVDQPYLGELVAKGRQDDLVHALLQRGSAQPDRQRIRQHALRFSWQETVSAYLRVLADS